MQSDQASHLDQSVCWDCSFLSGCPNSSLDNGAGGCWHSYFLCHKTPALLLAWWISLFFCRPVLLRGPALCAYLGWGTQQILSLKLLILCHTIKAPPDPNVCPHLILCHQTASIILWSCLTCFSTRFTAPTEAALPTAILTVWSCSNIALFFPISYRISYLRYFAI